MQTNHVSGFGNLIETEAIEGALPEFQNSPKCPPMGLYAEQVSGSAFTAPRHENLRTWCYRIWPSVVHETFSPTQFTGWSTGSALEAPTPNPLRWDPSSEPKKATTFLESVFTIATNGGPSARTGCAVHTYYCNTDMTQQAFSNSDGDLLVVPEKGKLTIKSEMGEFVVEPTEIALLPRGIKYQINPEKKGSRGYLLENYGKPFQLPGLGPIGSNGLANPRDFLAPVARFEDNNLKHELFVKFHGSFWKSHTHHSPFDVVGWHGNFYPCKYDLKRFNVINTVSFDHPDPSIFTVLTSPSQTPGTANIDFVIFPPRWMVAENTFRPPYFHRNVMSEFMGLIQGVYDAKSEGFAPGGYSLHNSFSAHGPDAETFEIATHAKDAAVYQKDTLAFMFESCLAFTPTEQAMRSSTRQADYLECWQGLKKRFKNP